MRNHAAKDGNTTATGRRSIRGRARALLRDRAGSSTVEFALVAIPLILLMLGILQVAFVYFANSALENATQQGARLIRTGQAQNNKFNASKFKNEVCKYLAAPLVCSKLQLDVRTFQSFSSADLTKPLDSGGNLNTNMSYDPGNGGDVVVVRAFYPFELAGLLPEIAMSNMKDGRWLLVATSAFRNEPFQGFGAAD